MPLKSTSAAVLIPERPTLPKLKQAVQDCRGCDLYRYATQAVFGEGPPRASIVFIGEEPGNDEDLQGHPFVGPAGKLLDRAFADAGIERSDVYLTNVIKHFKFEERGKRRIHKKPRASEIEACHPWLDAELLLLKPQIVVCLGATAAQTMLGAAFRLTQNRGEFFDHPQAQCVTATVHPSSILRAPDEQQRHAQYRDFVDDLVTIRQRLSTLKRETLQSGARKPARAPSSPRNSRSTPPLLLPRSRTLPR